MKRQYREFISDMLFEIKLIRKTVEGLSFEEFKHNLILIRAITRSFEIIGEATNYLPSSLKEKYSQVPWRDIKDFRNVISHKYWGVELEREWEIIIHELPLLQEYLEEILEHENIN